MKLLRHIFKNDLILYSFARLIPGIIAIVSLLLVIRVVAADQLGIYVLVTAGVGLLQIFSVEWIKAFVVRVIASGSVAGGMVSQGFRYLRLVNASIVFLGLTGFFLFVVLNTSFKVSGWLVLSSIFLFNSRAYFELEIAVLNASLLAKEYLRARLIRNTLQLTLFWSLAEYGAVSVHNFLFAQALSYALVSFLVNKKSVQSCREGGGSAPVTSEFRRRAMSFGLPVALSLSVDWIVSATDKILIGKFMGLSFAGQYGAIAEIMVQVVTLCFVIPYMTFYPRIVSASQKASGAIASIELFRFHGNLVVIGVVAFGLMSTIFPQSLGAVVWGDDLAVVFSNIVFPLTLGLCFFGLKTFYIDIIFHVHERADVIFKTSCTVALLNFFGNLLLIPEFGLMGAAWVTAISMGIGLGFSLVKAFSLASPYFAGFFKKVTFPIFLIFFAYLISINLDETYRILVIGSCAFLLIGLLVCVQRRLVM